MNSQSSSFCLGNFLLVALLPTLFVAFIGINHFNIINIVNISSYTFYIILVIYLIFLLFIPHNAFISSCRVKSNLPITRNELEKSLENTAITIGGKSKSVMSVRDFLEEYFKSVRNDNFAKIATSTFPMLGILGTFIAIAISMPDFTVNSSKELDNQISLLLSGVGTAFYASIFGIFLSLLWAFFERYGLSKIEVYTRSLEDIYTNYIWSKKELLKFQFSQKTLFEDDFTRHMREIFNLDFIKDINKEHMQNYSEIITKTQEGFKSLEKSLINANTKLTNSIHNLQASAEAVEATKSIQENISEFNRSTKELKELLETFDNGLDSAMIKIDRELATAVLQVEQMVKTLKDK